MLWETSRGLPKTLKMSLATTLMLALSYCRSKTWGTLVWAHHQWSEETPSNSQLMACFSDLKSWGTHQGVDFLWMIITLINFVEMDMFDFPTMIIVIATQLKPVIDIGPVSNKGCASRPTCSFWWKPYRNSLNTSFWVKNRAALCVIATFLV